MSIDDKNFRALYELSCDAIMMLDESTFLHCNEATLQIFNCSSQEVYCSKHPSEISPEYQPCGTSSYDLAQQHIMTALKNGHDRFEWMHKRLTGENFWAEVLLSPAKWEGKEVLQAVVRDISEQKKLQRNLQISKEKAEMAVVAKSEFLAVMSHEIRTPIHGIIGAQELLLNSKLNKDQRENVSLAYNSAKSLLSIVNDVLDFSKIESGKFNIEYVAFNAKQIVEDVRDILLTKANEKSINIECIFSDNASVYVMGDQTRLRQILLNLVSNAIKFSHEGDSVKLVSKFQPCGTEKVNWKIQVIDSGIGIEAEKQEKIFEVFSQADSSTTRKYGGTGLGLAICKALANIMGGDIIVSSQTDQGSVFELSIDIDVCNKDTITQVNKPLVIRRNYQKRILVAEDNPVNQTIIRKQLKRLGLESNIVGTGHDALAFYENSLKDKSLSVDLVLMDIQMPEMNGIDATILLRESGCSLPIIILTADALKERKEECIKAGANTFLVKPFEINELVSTLDEYL
ncbi:MAG: ATP-binding protein [Pseudomonadales bacterium]